MGRISERPITVIAFELISIASVVIEVALLQREREFEDPAYLGLWLVISSLWIALILWITRYRSRAGRMIYSVITASSIVAIVIFGIEADDQDWVAFLDGLTIIVLMALLWCKPTSSWIANKSSRDVA